MAEKSEAKQPTHRAYSVKRIPERLFQNCLAVTGWTNVENWSLERNRLDLSTGIVEDASLFSRLVDLLIENPGSTVSAYCATPQFAQLMRQLDLRGCKFNTAEVLSPKGLSLQSYLDSKAGFRSEASKLVALNIPEGFVCSDLSAVERSLIWFNSRSKACAIKSNRGESGWGTLMITPDQTPQRALATLNAAIQQDIIWHHLPFVVEEWIPARRPFSPSVEVLVTEAGAQVLYSCAQIVTEQGEFRGIVMGPNSVAAQIREEIEHVGRVLGNHYYKLGYRGYFDADFVVSDAGTVYALETNMRRTGGTHVFDFARAMHFSFDRTHLVSEDSLHPAAPIRNATDMWHRYSDLLFAPARRSVGILPTIVDPESNTFGYIGIAPTAQAVVDLRCSVWNIAENL